jgi:hypothetical protein
MVIVIPAGMIMVHAVAGFPVTVAVAAPVPKVPDPVNVAVVPVVHWEKPFNCMNKKMTIRKESDLVGDPKRIER